MRWLAMILLLPSQLLADALVTTRVIKAGHIIGADDISVVEANVPGAITDPSQAIGKEARVVIYPGRPILETHLGPPAIIERNQLVSLTYIAGAVTILTEGRALGRGGVGDVIPVQNLTSRNTVQGRVLPNGTVTVAPFQG